MFGKLLSGVIVDPYSRWPNDPPSSEILLIQVGVIGGFVSSISVDADDVCRLGRMGFGLGGLRRCL